MAELTPKTIAELPDVTPLTGVELFPVMDGSTSKKVPLSTLRNQFAMAAMGGVLDAGTNLDELLSPATYTVYGTREMTGTPPITNYSYKLFVIRGFRDGTEGAYYERVVQIAMLMRGDYKQFYRYHDNNGWTSWMTLDIAALDTQLPSLVADANINDGYVQQLKFYRWNLDTLNTPYKENATSIGYGMIIAYSISATACTQFCIAGGAPNVYIRRQYSDTWSSWERLISSAETQTGNALANVESNSVTVTSVTFPQPFIRTPQVVATCSGNLASAPIIASIGHLVRNVTTTGFELHVAVNTNVSFSQLSYRWVAISP